jgi:hypothetical protein
MERSPEHSQAAEDAIRDALERDPALAKQVSDLITQVKKLGPSVVVVQRIEVAENAVGVKAGRLRSGSVNLTQEVTKAGQIVGGEFDEIG